MFRFILEKVGKKGMQDEEINASILKRIG